MGVAYSDVDVLDNDVGHAVGDSETLSTDDTGTADSDNRPVADVSIIYRVQVRDEIPYLLLLTSMYPVPATS